MLSKAHFRVRNLIFKPSLNIYFLTETNLKFLPGCFCINTDTEMHSLRARSLNSGKLAEAHNW